MPAPLRIILTQADDEMLSELRVATTVPQRTRDRAHMLRLNALQVECPGYRRNVRVPSTYGSSDD